MSALLVKQFSFYLNNILVTMLKGITSRPSPITWQGLGTPELLPWNVRNWPN